MPPEQRRAAIMEATLPLLEQHGPALTTRQVAEAAGVAEGTIFRVFDSLQDLIRETALAGFSHEKLALSLDGVDLGGSLNDKTRATLELLAQRINRIRTLMMVLHHEHAKPDACVRDELDARRRDLTAWLAERFNEHTDELSVTATQYVSFLELLATGSAFHFEPMLDQDTTASLALHGALRKERP